MFVFFKVVVSTVHFRKEVFFILWKSQRDYSHLYIVANACLHEYPKCQHAGGSSSFKHTTAIMWAFPSYCPKLMDADV